MDPSITGTKYDKIAQFWHDRHNDSSYGMAQIEKALQFATGSSQQSRGKESNGKESSGKQSSGKALDVGCGAGGRFVRLLEERGFFITGLDVSAEMVQLARQNHPHHTFLHQDICTWETDERFDFILAWDSIFHLPYAMQKPVVAKLVGLLAEGGVLIYTFGNEDGDHTTQWQDDTFYYSSIGINNNLQVLMAGGLSVVHLELDQFPENHVYVIGLKP